MNVIAQLEFKLTMILQHISYNIMKIFLKRLEEWGIIELKSTKIINGIFNYGEYFFNISPKIGNLLLK